MHLRTGYAVSSRGAFEVRMMWIRLSGLCVVTLTTVFTTQVEAQDHWSEPAPGVSYLQRTTAAPLRMHAAVVDLSRDDLYLRATRPEERGRTTTNFSQHVGAVVAINGDWFGTGFEPVGLAVGQGVHWAGTSDSGWAFIACNVERECHYGNHTLDEDLYWRWYDVVGGNGWRLLVDGQIPTYPPDAFYTDRHPRSAVGTSADGQTMYFVVIEGRRPEESIGAGFAETAQFLQELGAHQALMFDGGGSSALTINESRVNLLPTNESGERTVANHLAILRGQPDAACAVNPNGRHCEGSVIHTCQGGAHQGEGDCGFFGASCDITSDGVGVCTHFLCTNGPERSFCESDTVIRTCSYGRPGDPGDCGFFGATCEDNGEDAYCVHFLCTEGGNAIWCDGDLRKECVNGQPQDDLDCAATGQICLHGSCQTEDSADVGSPTDAGDTGYGTPDVGSPDVGSDDTEDSGTTARNSPSSTQATTSSCAGCSATGSQKPPWSMILLGLAILLCLHSGRRRS
jgi:uncharacterized protein YigE (DUF2233 family)